MGKKKNRGLSQLKAASIRGRQSEENAKRVLKELFQMGMVERFRQTDRGSFEDRCGIDFYFTLLIKGCRIDIPLQVKSSRTGILEHERKKLNIKVVNGQAPDLKEQIKGIIQEYQETFDGQAVLEAMEFDDKGKLTNEPEIDELTNQHLETYQKEEREMSSLTLVREPEPEIEMIDGQALTSSRNVAEVFGKEHKNVMQSIEKLECSSEFSRLNFQPTSYTDSFNREQKMYLMTFDGFTFLAMGFTGSKAAQFKEQYIKAFNDMRQKLVTVQAAPAPVELSRKELIMLALKSEEELEEERQRRMQTEQEKLVLAEHNVKQYAVNVTLASEVAAAEAIFKKDATYTITDAVTFYDLPIKRNDLFNALNEKGYIRRKVCDDRKARWFPYAQFRTEDKPYFTVTPDYVDMKGNVHEGSLRITLKGLWKTYRDVCQVLGYDIDPKVEMKLQQMANSHQLALVDEDSTGAA